MSRPKKATVDYFPHYVNQGKTMFTIESKYGNDGYAFWFKILELLGGTEHHYLDCNDSQVWEYMLAKTRLSEEIATNILNTCAKLNAIDPDLWRIKVIRSNNFIINLDDVYKRRDIDVISNDEIIGLCKQKYPLNRIIVDIKPQSKLKETKLKEIKENESKKEEIILPFVSDIFIKMWEDWKTYKKKEHKFSYKSSISEQASLNELKEISGNNEHIAIKIINQSIANGWQGFFKLNKNKEPDKPVILGLNPFDLIAQ